MRSVRTIAFPPESRLVPRLAEASYHDAYEADLSDAALTALQIARAAFRSTPEWVEALVALRDRMVAPLGLKTVGRLGERLEAGEAPGEPFSIFHIESVDDDELVLAIDDAHLDVRLSFLKRRAGQGATYVIATVVETHNRLGRLYMLPVGRAHKAIVRLMMRGLKV
jgi:hypothetical protein